MSISNSFPPIAAHDAKALILGTMPGVMSLAKQQYYGHPRNAFWPIITTLFKQTTTDLDYQERKNILLQNGIALWDVLQSCLRSGSLDADIQLNSIQANNFNDFFLPIPGHQLCVF